MSDIYRWIVRVEGDPLCAAYAREVTTFLPYPGEAVIVALGKITADDEDDLWQRDKLTVTVERVR